MLEVTGAYKSFATGRGKNKRMIHPLNGADLYVGDGDIVGIFGKSGEGKSTLANIICGFLKPDGGNVYLDEIPLYDEKGRYDIKVGKKIQLIPQQPYLSFDPMQRVGKAIEEVLLINGRAKDAADARAKSEELFLRVSLDCALLNRLPRQLSGGQVQRAAIARALAINPDVVISDEATAMLDATAQAQIVKIFKSLADDDGISVIFISHDERLLNSFVQKKYELKDGTLVEAPLSKL